MNEPLVNAVHSVDRTFLFIAGASAVILVLIVCTMVYFLFRYSRKRNPVPTDIPGNLWLEVAWTVLPTILVLGMFASGLESFRALREVPKDALVVEVNARMWSWKFQYPNGKKSSALYVPVGRPVKLELHSEDVIHGFYAPAFRLKADAVPGLTNYAWFRAEKEGEHVIYCTVYCGLQHAKMLSSIRAVPAADFEKWLASAGEPAGADSPGRKLLDEKGCLGCHTLDGSPSVGPTLKDIFGHSVVLVDDSGKETTVVADEAYLRRSIVGPKKAVVKGFEPVMPNFKDQLTDEELRQILDFLKNQEAPAMPDGETVAQEQGCLGCHSTDGSILVGPSFKGLWGSEAVVDGPGGKRKMKVDEDFVRSVLKEPSKMHIEGFQPVMPPFPDLSEPEVQALLHYLQSLDHGGGAHQ